ncbi:MAG: ABC transporter permease, partial [Erysipelotrichaceae bacterium]
QNAASSVHSDALSDLFKKILEGWQNSSQQTLSAYQQGLSDYLSSDEARKILSDHLKDIFKNGSDSILTSDNLEKVVLQLMDGFEDYQKQHSEEDISTLLNGYLQSETGQADLQAACSSLSGSLSDLDLSSDDLNSLLSDLENGYQTYAASHGTPTGEDLRTSFETYLTSDETSALISSSLPAVIDTNALSASVSSVLQNTVSSYTSAFSTQLSAVMTSLINQYADALTRTMANAMSQVSGIDGEKLANAFSINMDEDDLQNLLTSMMSGRTTDYASNLKSFGYADEDNPSEIDLYPKDFDSRSNIRSILDSYNKSVQDKGQKDKTIVYTDLVATMLSSVTDIIHTISYILIAFVGISLVVSSIMIGVITYISVLERRKEIGILRALGASRHNIAQVFNAETFITGLLSGLIGVVSAILLCIPLSSVIHHMAQTDSINMSLPLESALGLILLSIVLTVIAGIIPSHKAAKSDPVAALRTE